MKWLGRLWNRGRLEAELRNELEYHLQRQADDYVQTGLTEEEARRKARLLFGGAAQIDEECRDVRGTRWLESVLEDLRFSQRVLRKSPGFTLAAIVTLALGIGANMAIFRLLDAVRLRALPVKDPQQLAIVQLADRIGWRGNQATSYPTLTNPIWERFRDTQQAFASVLAWDNSDFNTALGGEVHMVRGMFVSGEFFNALGVHPLMGRVFTAADDRRGCGVLGAVVSYDYWQRELFGDPSAVGKRLTLNYRQVDIVGVTPAGFSGLEVGRSYDVAVPICSQAALWNAGNWLDEGTVWWLTVMGRINDGNTPAQVNARLMAGSPALFRTTVPPNYPSGNVKDFLRFKLKAVPGSGGVSALRDEYGHPLLLLLGTTGLVLLIACANLANLALARASARSHEYAVRLAIGASRWRLIQQLMIEAMLLTVSGVVAGLALSNILTRFLIHFLGGTLFLDTAPDWRMLAFCVGVAGLTCILFGLTPALQSTRTDAAEAMKTGGRTLSASRERFGTRRILVVAQVSLSLVLLVSALLFSASLRNLLSVDTGFQQNGLLVTDVDLSRLEIPVDQRIVFRRNLLERIRAVAGVTSAAEASIVPLSGAGNDNQVWLDHSTGTSTHTCYFNWTGPGYLKTMRIPLVAGRDFNDHDRGGSPRVAIVNQAFVRMLGLGADPIGKRFRREATASEPEIVVEVVGVVKDTKYHNLREEFQPIAFLSVAQTAEQDPFAQIVIRSSASLPAVADAVRKLAKQVNAAIIVSFGGVEDAIREGLMRERLLATLSSFFGVLAVLIAAVGLYGVMSYLVVRRTSEIGVRIALGASKRNIVGMILGESAALLALGTVCGVVLAVLATRTAQSMLYGVKPHDARTLFTAVTILAVVTLLASYLPARRASRLEPMMALREQ